MRLVPWMVVVLVGCGRYFGTDMDERPDRYIDAGQFPRPDAQVYYPDAYRYPDAYPYPVDAGAVVYPDAPLDAATYPPDAPTDAPCHISPGHPQGGCTGHP